MNLLSYLLPGFYRRPLISDSNKAWIECFWGRRVDTMARGGAVFSGSMGDQNRLAVLAAATTLTSMALITLQMARVKKWAFAWLRWFWHPPLEVWRERTLITTLQPMQQQLPLLWLSNLWKKWFEFQTQIFNSVLFFFSPKIRHHKNNFYLFEWSIIFKNNQQWFELQFEQKWNLNGYWEKFCRILFVFLVKINLMGRSEHYYYANTL